MRAPLHAQDGRRCTRKTGGAAPARRRHPIWPTPRGRV